MSETETIEQYFSRTDTPSAESPVGKAMVKVKAKYPSLSFDDARAKARDLLHDAAGRKVYQTPTVYSEEELVARKAQSDAYWASRSASAAALNVQDTPVPAAAGSL
jgi:hypothetical protein